MSARLHDRASQLLLASGLLAAFALLLRLPQRQVGLLYPDSYQYLLSARGIGEHLRPLTRLGPGGDLFVPSVDAADKPLYPALVAAAHALGAEPRHAAGLISALAAAAVLPLAACLAYRLSRSLPAALAAAAALAASPALAYWSGFAGSDPLAQALVLSACLALSFRRPTATGLLAGLAGLARPEYLLLATAAALAASTSRTMRRLVARACVAAAAPIAIVLALVRPPLAFPVSPAALAAALVLGTAGFVAAWWAVRSRAWTRAFALGLPTAVAVAAHAERRFPALSSLGRLDLLLVALASAGLVVAAWRGPRRETLLLCVAGTTLAGCYLAKNPSQERYLAQLAPLAALALALALAALPRPVRWPVLAAAVICTLPLLLLQPARIPAGPGSFAAIATGLQDEHGVLWSATPDAYALYLPKLGQRQLRAGGRGLVLLDAAARYYQPQLAVHGILRATLTTNVPFARPDGQLDRGGARLVQGRIVVDSPSGP